ncbi:MAG: polyribonucleotide nucleotidyltransferase, partial [Alphaproteobacteria bacterium]|nr:polyribonucleotide nucleotidyltransferase [Alphaproteobacteria bacterium]
EEIDWGGRPLIIETGKIARQADGAVLATYGETSVLATVVADRNPKAGIDFFPLTVNYQEKNYAAGKIPGGYFKREGRPSEKETLVSRLIDRPIRPLFVKGFKNETQIIATVISHDLENDSDIVAMVAVSAALTISGLPFLGPIGAARIGYIDGAYQLNPTFEEMSQSQLDLVVAGTQDAVLMVESEAQELSEEVMLGAVMYGQNEFQKIIQAIIRLAEKCAKPPMDIAETDNTQIQAQITDLIGNELETAYQQADKAQRQDQLAAAHEKLYESLLDENATDDDKIALTSAVKKIESDIVRGAILSGKKRIDGRALADIRPIASEVGVLPRAHGSALFTRGETQALVVATLGTGDDEQFIDAIEGAYKSKFLLHYNFPPYSVGETGRVGFTSRRETGHGKLAWRALRPLLPKEDEFPYTLRLVSEITESNGSSSMATVCGASLAMMDAGVPIAKPIAGIAMGLIKEGDNFAVLSDILGDEDHLGDMDFKVAGTQDGITALQMDIKITGITEEIMQLALAQAKTGRAHILDEMGKALGHARTQMGEHAPKIETILVAQDKIRDIIGPGGKVIREIVEQTGAKIDIADDGTVKIASPDNAALADACGRINAIIAEPETGQVYDGTVVKVMEFGAFVNFFGQRDGLVHISQLKNERVQRTSDVVHEGDKVKVKLVGFDDRGKARLSMKLVDQKTGEDLETHA